MPQIDPLLSFESVDADWLSRLLGQEIGIVSSTPVGTGQVGATYRFVLTADQSSQNVPASLIGKFMATDPISRATGIAQSSYLREVNFYNHYGRTQGLPIPICHFGAIDPASHDFILIMEDFPKHRSGNQLEPASLQEAQLAMDAAARLHAPFWGDTGLDQQSWLNGSKAIEPMNVDALYTMLWPAFCDRYQARIGDEIKAVGEGYSGRINAWIANRSGPRCLTHGDYRPDNMLFLEGDTDRPLVIVDWQTAGVGNGATDIAYYLGTALSPDMRRTHEAALVDRWIKGLIAAGIAQSETAQLWDCYRRDAVAGFIMGVLASMIVVQTPRGNTMFLEMCSRSAQMVLDHDAIALI